MPKNKKSIYAGGWDPTKAERLANVQLPEKMKCSTCRKVKAMATYSKKQSTDLRNHIALGNALDDSTIRCRKCTGSQVHEMTCSICGEVKGLEGFSKAQRRTPDNARCLECVDEHLALHPDQVQEWDRDDNDGESGLDSDETSNPYENTETATDVDLVSSSINQLNVENMKNFDQITGSEPTNRAGSYLFTDKENVPVRSTENNPDGSVWREYARNNKLSTQGKAPPTEFTGWDTRGNAHQRFRAASSAMSEDNTSVQSPGGASSKFTRGKDSNFAKPKESRFAKPPRAEPLPTPIYSRATGGRQVQYDDSDSDDEFGYL